MESYQEIARESRIKCLELVYKAQTSHIGSLFSAADIMAVLFSKIDLDKDRFVLSAGWKACLLYFHLWKKGRITEEELNSYCQPGSKWIGLVEPVHKDIILAGGSLGLGFPGAVGLAMAKKMNREEGTIFCLMSDGEQQVGTTWESALIASQYQLDNLVVLIDNNGFCAMGKTEEILNIEPLERKWDAFGWDWGRINGHDYKAIERELDIPLEKPRVIICDTTKGKGVSFFEGDNIWHYKSPSKEEYEQALAELRELST